MLVSKHTHRLIGRDRHARCAGTHAQGRGAELNPRCAPVACCGLSQITWQDGAQTAEDYDRHPPESAKKHSRRAAGRASLPSLPSERESFESFVCLPSVGGVLKFAVYGKIPEETKVPGPNGWMNRGHPPLETPGLGSRWPPPRGRPSKRGTCGRRRPILLACLLRNHTSHLLAGWYHLFVQFWRFNFGRAASARVFAGRAKTQSHNVRARTGTRLVLPAARSPPSTEDRLSPTSDLVPSCRKKE